MARKKNSDAALSQIVSAHGGMSVSESAATFKRGAWQDAAYRYTDEIGELSYTGGYVANAVSRGAWPIERFAELDEDGKPTGNPIPEELSGDRDYEWVDAERVPEVARFKPTFCGPSGGFRQLMYRAAFHLWVGGESHCIGVPDDVEDRIIWEFLSTIELSVDEQGKLSRKGVRKPTEFSDGMGEGVEIPQNAFYRRVHNPHPAIAADPMSPVQRILPHCRELALLTQMIEAQAKSRLSAGLLLIPNEISFGSDDKNPAGAGAGLSNEMDPVIAELMRHMISPVEDRTSAASVAPMVLRGAAEFLEKVRMNSLAQEITKDMSSLRAETLKRIGNGLDLPPEKMTGIGSTTHWNGNQIDADFIDHVIPMGELLAEFLTEAVLRPALVAEGIPEEQVCWYRWRFDISELMGREDLGPAGRALHDRVALSDATLRRVHGFEDMDAPDATERRARIVLELIESKTPADAREAIRLMDEMGFFEGDGMDLEMPEDRRAIEAEIEDVPDTPQDDIEEPAPEVGDRVAPQTGEADDLSMKVLGMAEGAVTRALEVVGSRVMAAAHKHDRDFKDRLRSHRKTDVVHVAGVAGIESLKLTRNELFTADLFDEFETAARGVIRAEFRNKNIRSADADALLAAKAISKHLLALAATSLDEALPLVDGMRVPAALVTDVIGLNKGFA